MNTSLDALCVYPLGSEGAMLTEAITLAKQYIDTRDMRRSNAAMSTLIVRCANGEAVAFDGGVMRCTHYPLVPL